MASTSVKIDLAVSADTAWDLIGGFGSLPDWIPTIMKSEPSEGGRVRHFVTNDGVEMSERLIAFDQNARSYTYAIEHAPIPVKHYLSVLRVEEVKPGQTCLVEWSGDFEPDGVSEEQATDIVFGIYDGGLKALRRKFVTESAEGSA